MSTPPIHSKAEIPINSPTSEQAAKIVISAADNDLDSLINYKNDFGPDSIFTARDDVGHSILHAVCEKGHLGLYITIHLSQTSNYLIRNPRMAFTSSSSVSTWPFTFEYPIILLFFIPYSSFNSSLNRFEHTRSALTITLCCQKRSL